MSTQATITASTLNVRATSAGTALILGQLARGARVSVLARDGDWYQVTSDGLAGFVNADYVRLDSTPVVDGFLCHDGRLCAPALSLAPAKPIVDTGAKPMEQTAARTWNRYGGVLAPLCDATGISTASAIGVLCVESSGQGMTDAGKLIIRFENHVFWDQWGKRHEADFRAHFAFDAAKRWTNQRYRASSGDAWKTSHGVGQGAEWEAFGIARALDEQAAMQSVSMGAPQIMGFNHAAIGYDSAREMFERFGADERYHILGLFDFVKGGGATSRMLEALRREQYDQFATYYNGNGQAAAYGARIRAAAAAFTSVAAK
ncbi:MAG TPA: N-acetylmuramidase domain-containing protein [Gemmatimonadaceae bacterium]|nr:N-acetylmuramidase domain-containing protein [Gemmatimonadaceae bacterium]